jgi:hypothetical protein
VPQIGQVVGVMGLTLQAGVSNEASGLARGMETARSWGGRHVRGLRADRRLGPIGRPRRGSPGTGSSGGGAHAPGRASRAGGPRRGPGLEDVRAARKEEETETARRPGPTAQAGPGETHRGRSRSGSHTRCSRTGTVPWRASPGPSWLGQAPAGRSGVAPAGRGFASPGAPPDRPAGTQARVPAARRGTTCRAALVRSPPTKAS